MNRFDSSLRHLIDATKRIDLMLRREIAKMRELKAQSDRDELRGLYISEEDVDDSLSTLPLALSTHPSIPSGTDTEVSSAGLLPDSPAPEVSGSRGESLRSAVPLRLEHLRRCFDLSPFELDCLLVALLPELDLRYQRLYAYLQDDVTKKAPTVDMALKLLASSLPETVALRTAFLPQGRLSRHCLLSVSDPPATKNAPLLERILRLDQRVVDYLLGSNQVDFRLQAFVRLTQRSVGLEDVLLPQSCRARLLNLIHSEIPPQGAVILLHGPQGSGRRMTAEALCHQWETPLLLVDSGRLLASELPAELATSILLREVSLQRACPYWHGFELLLSDERTVESYRLALVQGLIRFPGIVFLGSQLPWESGASLGKPFLQMELPMPSFGDRKKLWQIHLGESIGLWSDIDTDALANKFRFTGGQIRDTIAAASDFTMGRCRGNGKMTTADLYEACRNQSSRKLTAMARRVTPKFKWDDIVLPKDQMAQLREIVNHVQYRQLVFGQWNFDQKMSLGKGLNVLFSGPSGTGKTMAAEIMAGELGLDLYKIDLSTVVSKYIGETEKNLDRIFREAQDSNAILFFDEADAIFGKRSEVRDSHDRYANIEIAYLLQKMEEYDGIVILATNLRKNLDEAFARRMQFTVEFPLPEESDRCRIWRQVFPKEAPLSSDADLGFMARQFKITGGNIKNIALGAAFLAASDGGVITTEQLVKATKREYQKIGRLCTETDFGPYFELVKG